MNSIRIPVTCLILGFSTLGYASCGGLSGKDLTECRVAEGKMLREAQAAFAKENETKIFYWPRGGGDFVTGNKVPEPAKRAVAAFQKQASLGAQRYRVRKVSAEDARKGVVQMENIMPGSILQGTRNDIKGDTEYWRVSTDGMKEIFGYLRADNEKLVFLCRPPEG